MASPTAPLPDQAGEALQISDSPVQFPLGWMLSNASSALQYRAIIDVCALTGIGNEARSLSLGFRPALALAMAQGGDGTWADSILSASNGSSTVATVPAFRRLLEYGWERESPPLIRARRVLFRLLAEDDDADQLFEFRAACGTDIDLVRRARRILREASAAALAQAGYEGDPRLRGAARRLIARVDAYLSSPLAQHPWERVGNRHVLAAEASPPSIHLLAMLAHMPLFRSEHHSQVHRIFTALTQPLPRQEPYQLAGTHAVAQPHLLLGDPLGGRQAADADVPFALFWLELMARLQFLRKHDSWMQVYERFLDDRDRDFVWHPRRGAARPVSANPDTWACFPLEDDDEGEHRYSDVTFRLGLIARLLGRPVEVV